jgi:hypothetical protein
MTDQPSEPRVDTAVPHPPTEHLSEEQKKALELQADVEHTDGLQRERLTEEADRLGDKS